MVLLTVRMRAHLTTDVLRVDSNPRPFERELEPFERELDSLTPRPRLYKLSKYLLFCYVSKKQLYSIENVTNPIHSNLIRTPVLLFFFSDLFLSRSVYLPQRFHR